MAGAGRRASTRPGSAARSYARPAFANFAEHFTAEGDTRLAAPPNKTRSVARGFVVTDAMVEDFKHSLQSEKVKIDEAAFAKDEDFIKAMIHFEIDVALFGIAEAQKNLIAKDPQAQFALAQFAEAREADGAGTDQVHEQRRTLTLGHSALHFVGADCPCPRYGGLLD